MKADYLPLVSVVTPAYNGENHLTECIESVLAQTYQNWEYIIVNNCSTDRSLEIARTYAEKDARIRIVNNKVFVDRNTNGNIALRQVSAEAKYCKMVHADDWLYPECLTQMVSLAEANPSVGIVGAYGLVGGSVLWDGLPYLSTVVSGREICRRTLLESFYVFGTPTSILLRADLLQNRIPLYNEANYHADAEACFDLLQHSDFGFVHQVLTFTRTHSEAASGFANHFNTYDLSTLIILTRYGPSYLSKKEYDQCLKLHMKLYYDFLARSLFYRRDAKVLEYHKKGMRDFGFSFSWAQLFGALSLEMGDVLLNPKQTFERLARRIMKLRCFDGRG